MTTGLSPRHHYTLLEWLQWQETLHPSLIDLGLDRIRKVAHILWGEDFTSTQPTTITVAGTNGKGSCVTVISVLMQGLGKRVGSFTSPHLFRYNERIRINNKEVSDADLCAAFAVIDTARGDISLTYFEFNALAAFWIFRQYQVDIQVLEVGLGGRLDAVNLLDADIAVITNIALDHVDWLGDTREKIGAEKAGILRQHGKLVYGEEDMPDSIRTQVNTLHVASRQMCRQFSCSTGRDGFMWHGQDKEGGSLMLTTALPQLPLPSVACALQVLAWLGWWDAALFARLLPAIMLAGRMERLYSHDGEWILDVAHNEAGARFLADRLQQSGHHNITALFSAMSDKDLAGIFSALLPVVTRWVLIPLQDNPRAATIGQLHAAALAAGIDAVSLICVADVQDAVKMIDADKQAEPVLVCGSFFTVAAVRECLS